MTAVPNIFANASGSIPLSQLDANFAAFQSTSDATSVGAALIGYLAAVTGAVGMSLTAKLGQIVNALDIGCACDGTTDDFAKIYAFVIGEVSDGRAPCLAFPPGSTTRVSEALPFRNGVSYLCVNGFATIKATDSSTDNVIGEFVASPCSGVYMQNIIVDGNKAGCAYNLRGGGGVTDDGYQNCILLNSVSDSVFMNVWAQNAVMNGWVTYDGANDNVFIRCRATDIGKTPNPISGFFSYNGMDFAFGVSRNVNLFPYVNTCRGIGIREVGDGADNYDNMQAFPIVIAAAGDAGISIADGSGTNTTHRPKIICPTVLDCTSLAMRIQPQGGGAVDDALVLAPTFDNCGYGLVTNGAVNRLRAPNVNIRNMTNDGVSIGASATDAQISGQSMSNGTDLTDNGTRTCYDLITTGGAHLTKMNLPTSGAGLAAGQIYTNTKVLTIV